MLRGTLGFAALIAVALGARSTSHKPPTKPSRYLYVWAGAGHDSTTGIDMITVLDANPASKTYGAVLSAVTLDSSGLMPHHIEYVLPARGPLFANDYTGDKSFLIDFSNPLKPRLSARLAHVPGGRKVHTFIRPPTGTSSRLISSATPPMPGNREDWPSSTRRAGWSAADRHATRRSPARIFALTGSPSCRPPTAL